MWTANSKPLPKTGNKFLKISMRIPCPHHPTVLQCLGFPGPHLFLPLMRSLIMKSMPRTGVPFAEHEHWLGSYLDYDPLPNLIHNN